MEIKPFDIALRDSCRAVIYQSADVHLFSEGHDTLFHRRFCHHIGNDPDAYWVDTGDLTEDDRPTTRERRKMMYHDRPEAHTLEDRDHMARLDRYVIPRLKPIANKCLGLLAGDHYRVYNGGMNSTQYIARKLGVPYLGERMGYIAIVFSRCRNKEIRYDILARHGRGGGATPGADLNRLIKQNARWDADLLIGAHTHEDNCHIEPVVGVNKNRDNFCQRMRIFIRGGSFMRGFMVGKQGYAEAAEYSPLCIGYGMAELFFGMPGSNNNNLKIVEYRATLCAG